MPIDSVMEENVEKLRKERDEKRKELNELKNTTINQMWTRELCALEMAYDKYRYERKSRQEGLEEKEDKKVKKITKKVTKKIVKHLLRLI
jgi:hypothetical protein